MADEKNCYSWRCLLFVGLCAVFISYCYCVWTSPTAGVTSVDDVLSDVRVSEELKPHARDKVEPEIVKVIDGVYVAIGFALANSILLEGPSGLIIVDTTESLDAATEILKRFRQIIADKPIEAIIYTHSHPDHVNGAANFIEAGSHPSIWAYHTVQQTALLTFAVGPKIHRGSVHQFGVRLGDHLVDVGIGPRLRDNVTSGHLAIPPTRYVYREREDVTIAGLNITLIHIPGETPDHMAIWIPSLRVVLPGDDIYKSFPNLYAIRGTPPRNIMVWAESLQTMRDLNAIHLVPSHTRPVSGQQVIYDLLTVYMSGIQFIHDQTIRHMNQILHPDEIARKLKLPRSIESHPYWEPLYGRVDWSVKAVYCQYFGWFSGDPVDLNPLAPTERSERMVKMIGAEKILEMAEEALRKNDLQWGLELSSYVYRINSWRDRAKETRMKILQALASSQWNPLARNYYMTAALDQFGLVDWKLDLKPVLQKLIMSDLLNLMRYRLQTELTDGVNLTLIFNYTDVNEVYCMRVIYSVLHVERVTSLVTHYDVKLTTTSTVWRQIVTQEKSPIMAYLFGDIVVDGSIFTLRRFMTYFERPKMN